MLGVGVDLADLDAGQTKELATSMAVYCQVRPRVPLRRPM